MGDDIDFFVRGGVKIFNIRIFRVIFYIDFIIFLWGLCPVLSGGLWVQVGGCHSRRANVLPGLLTTIVRAYA